MLPYIIHNRENALRFERLKYELQTQGISHYSIFDAIMMANPVTGCNRSHKEIIKCAKVLGKKYVCIFEDDIQFTAPGSWAYFLQVFDQLPADWDIYSGGVYWAEDMTPAGDHLRKVKKFSSTHCIIVRDTIYEHILRCPDHEHIDRWLWEFGGNYYVSWPMPAIQYTGYSYIRKGEVNYNDMLKSFELYK